jgi:hypothetical protein
LLAAGFYDTAVVANSVKAIFTLCLTACKHGAAQNSVNTAVSAGKVWHTVFALYLLNHRQMSNIVSS